MGGARGALGSARGFSLLEAGSRFPLNPESGVLVPDNGRRRHAMMPFSHTYEHVHKHVHALPTVDGFQEVLI